MKPSERRKARRLAVQAIYSWQQAKITLLMLSMSF